MMSLEYRKLTKRDLGTFIDMRINQLREEGAKEDIDLKPDCREGVRTQLERMKELCKERNSLYEKQNDLKGQKWKIEKSLER